MNPAAKAMTLVPPAYAIMTTPDGAEVQVYHAVIAHQQELADGLVEVITITGLRGVVPRGWLR